MQAKFVALFCFLSFVFGGIFVWHFFQKTKIIDEKPVFTPLIEIKRSLDELNYSVKLLSDIEFKTDAIKISDDSSIVIDTSTRFVDIPPRQWTFIDSFIEPDIQGHYRLSIDARGEVYGYDLLIMPMKLKPPVEVPSKPLFKVYADIELAVEVPKVKRINISPSVGVKFKDRIAAFSRVGFNQCSNIDSVKIVPAVGLRLQF